MTEEFDDSLLKAKEEKFIDYVELASTTYELQYAPKVVFCDGYIPDKPSVLACIDTSSWVIFVSRIHLREMPIEKIKEVAFHEVTHLFNSSHDTFFRNKLDDIMRASWKPEFTSGLIHIDGGRITEEEYEEPKEHKIDDTHCNYHLCKKETEVIRCFYCSGYYCKEHIKAIPPSFPNFECPNEFVLWKQKEECHPCPEFYDFLVIKEKERIRKTEESFNRMRRMKLSGVKKRRTSNSVRTPQKRKSFWNRLKNRLN